MPNTAQDLLVAREIAATIEEERIRHGHLDIRPPSASDIRAGNGDYMPAVIAALRAFELIRNG